MRKIFIIMLTLGLSLSSLTGLNVKAANNEENVPEIVDGTNMSLQEIDELLSSSTEYTIELSDQQVAEQYALKEGVSLEEAYKAVAGYSSQKNKLGTLAASSCSWLATNTSVTIKNKSYKPNLIVYVEICRSGAQYINTNKKPLLQEFQANAISFSGTISVELFNGHFYYIVNGNFYNSTSTTHTGTTGVTTVFSATYSVGSTSNYYASLTTSRTKRDVLGY
ncbi:hypothetical protein [Solibacillus sp. NPDC093137]|uniref:hypothetical protein n=1 Tax=Solibacillus sp. NPDC093137 TaxID=3390678 RepID=UPI003CFCAA26